MDFDDLDEVEAAAGPTPEEQRQTMVDASVPEEQAFPFPSGKNFGTNNKMKMLFLHGGGTNKKIAQMQVTNVFKEVPDQKNVLEWVHWSGPHSVPLGWNGDYSLQPFGPDFSVYFERLPYANCQQESWEGIEETFKSFKAFLKENGPFDGVCGFDMGGELLVHAARKAQEGDDGFKGMFRFMILFTTGSSKHLSPLGSQRPKAQLRIPAIVSWCNGDQNHTYMWYEETVLFFHKNYREVILHQSGHMPPRIVKETSEHERLVRFLEDMRRGRSFTPSDHPDNAWCRGLFLPMSRTGPPALPSSFKKRLLVVPDPMGAHDYAARLDDLLELKKKDMLPVMEGKPFVCSGSPPDPIAAMELKRKIGNLTHEAFEKVAVSGMSVEAVAYDETQRKFNWHCKPAEVPSPMLNVEDIIDKEEHVQTARGWADSLARNFTVDEDDVVGIVGLGTGAFIAHAIAKLLIYERKRMPACLWVVNPPTRLPWSTTMEPGALLNCPVRAMVNETSTCGPTWRYEVSTCGPFSFSTFKDIDSLVQTVVDEFEACR